MNDFLNKLINAFKNQKEIILASTIFTSFLIFVWNLLKKKTKLLIKFFLNENKDEYLKNLDNIGKDKNIKFKNNNIHLTFYDENLKKYSFTYPISQFVPFTYIFNEKKKNRFKYVRGFYINIQVYNKFKNKIASNQISNLDMTKYFMDDPIFRGKKCKIVEYHYPSNAEVGIVIEYYKYWICKILDKFLNMLI